MIKAILVTLVLMVPTQASATSKQESFCTNLSDMVFNIATARDMGISILKVHQTLLAAGLPYEVAEGLSTSVYYVLKDKDPTGVKDAYYMICMSEPV